MSKTTTPDLAALVVALREAAEKATPGNWGVEDPMDHCLTIVANPQDEVYDWLWIAICDWPDEDSHLITAANVKANAALIALANPVNTIALLDAYAEQGRKLEEVKTDAAFWSKTLLRFRDTLLAVRDGLEEEGDRTYFGSTNDADALSDIIGDIDDLAWDEIMAATQPPVDLRKTISAYVTKTTDQAATIAALTAEVANLKGEVAEAEGLGQMQRDQLTMCQAEVEALKRVVVSVAHLNRDAGEVGAGMLCQLVDQARRALATTQGEG